MKINLDLSKILNKSHEKKWVALSSDRTKVVDCASSLVELKGRVGAQKVIYMKVLPSDTSFAF